RARSSTGRDHHSRPPHRPSPTVAPRAGTSPRGAPHPHNTKPPVRGAHGRDRAGHVCLPCDHRQPRAVDDRTRHRRPGRSGRAGPGRRRPGAGRLGYRALVRRVGVRTRTVVILGGIAVTTALLGVFTSLAALVIVAVLAGFVRGIMTLLQATAVTDRWGPTHYG